MWYCVRHVVGALRLATCWTEALHFWSQRTRSYSRNHHPYPKAGIAETPVGKRRQSLATTGGKVTAKKGAVVDKAVKENGEVTPKMARRRTSTATGTTGGDANGRSYAARKPLSAVRG